MSLVRFNKNGKIVYCEYNSTRDFMRAKLFETEKEMDKYWRKEQPLVNNCKHESEDVEIYSTYGGGFSWEGKACRKCMQLIDGLIPDFIEDTVDGEPEWATEYYNSLKE